MADSMGPRTDEQIDAAIERAKAFEGFPRIVEAVYRSEPGFEFLSMKLDDGRRLLLPREELAELKSATTAQAQDLFIIPQGRGVWWPQIDDGCTCRSFWSIGGVRGRRIAGLSGALSRLREGASAIARFPLMTMRPS